MLEIKTKKILRNGEMVIINACNFDPKVHEEWKSEAERAKAKEAEHLKAEQAEAERLKAEAEAEAQRIIDEAKKANKK